MYNITKDRQVELVAYGKGSYFVKFDDGSMSWQNIPSKLEEILGKCQQSTLPAMCFLSLGAHNQYFVRLSNGVTRRGMNARNDKFLRELAGDVREVQFCGSDIIVR